MKIINDFSLNLTLYSFENEKNGERMEDHFIHTRGASVQVAENSSHMVGKLEFSLQ